MVKIYFPALVFPAFKFKRGQLLNVNLLGVGLVIPPFNITFWNAVTLSPKRLLFDTNWIVNALLAPIIAIPMAVWSLLESVLDEWVEEYYAAVEETEE